MFGFLKSMFGYEDEPARRTLQEVQRGVLEFRLDRSGVDRPYSQRLAQKQGWDGAFTARVIEEYRRFLVLAWDAAQRKTVAVPSETVDQAWHLHLEDTTSYWALCEEVFGMQIHHFPSESANADSRYVGLYADTFDRYFAIFRESPPADIWGQKPERPKAPAPAVKPAKKSSSGSSRSKSSAKSSESNAAASCSTFIPIVSCGGGSAPSAPSCGGGSSAPSCGGGAASCGGGGCGGGGGGCGGGGCGGGS